MRIGIDARELSGRATGVGRYLAHLLAEWNKLEETGEHQFRLYVPEKVQAPARFDQRLVPGTGATWWEQVSVAREASRDRLDVFFGPGFSVPLLLRLPLVVAIHDLSFMSHPEWFRPRERWRRRWLARRSARKARAVLAFSEFTARELMNRFGIPQTSIEVIPHGVSPIAPRRPTRNREPLVLFVGSIFNRRHLPTLIAAMARLAPRHPEARLAIVGENRTYPHQNLAQIAERFGIRERLLLPSYVDESTLADFYARARAFAFLSEYEGFGFPPLEALASGVPVVVTDTPVAREIYGGAVRYVAHGDVEGVARELEQMLSGHTDSEAGEPDRVLSRYCWERTARATLAVLERAASVKG